MKLLATLFASTALIAAGGESYFFTRDTKAGVVEKRIEQEQLHILIPIKRLEPPKASSIYAFRQGLGRGREYQIQIDLVDAPKEGWPPMLKLGDEVIDGGIYTSGSGKEGGVSSLHLESDDPEQIRRWCRLLGPLLKLSEEQIEIDLTKSEQGGAGQPATTPKSKPESNEKPEPESKPAPR